MDTWGISGGHFIALYIALLAGVFACAYALRRRVVRDREPSSHLPELDVYELALLNEGPRLVIAAAAANLRDAGALAVREGDGALVVAEPPAGAPHELEWRVGEAVRGERAEDQRRLAA